MAESKRIFNAGKMNRDLDDRLVQPGEFRDALNINIGRSEGSDVGAVENLKGNELIQNQDAIQGTTIGQIRDQSNNNIYWFTSGETQDAIYEYDGTTVNTVLIDNRTGDVPEPNCVPELTSTTTGPDTTGTLEPSLPPIPPTVSITGGSSTFTQPASGSVTFRSSVIAGSDEDINYLWSSGETTETITVTSSVSASINRTLTVTASDGGTATSNVATATFTAEAPPPVDQSVPPTLTIQAITEQQVGGGSIPVTLDETFGTNTDGSAATLTSRTWTVTPSSATTSTLTGNPTSIEIIDQVGDVNVEVTLVTSAGTVTDDHDISITAQAILRSTVALNVVNNIDVGTTGQTINASGDGTSMMGRYSPPPAETWLFESVLDDAPAGFEYTTGPTASGTGVTQVGNTASVSGTFEATNTNPTITWSGTLEAEETPHSFTITAINNTTVGLTLQVDDTNNLVADELTLTASGTVNGQDGVDRTYLMVPLLASGRVVNTAGIIVYRYSWTINHEDFTPAGTQVGFGTLIQSTNLVLQDSDLNTYNVPDASITT